MHIPLMARKQPTKALEETLRTSWPCRYEVGRKKGEYDEETLKREQAKNALERYMHYYQR